MGLNWTNKQDLVDTILAADVNALAAAIIALEDTFAAGHASTHATGGSDPITPASIGAQAAPIRREYTEASRELTIALEDNTEYIISSSLLYSLTLTFPDTPFDCWLRFTITKYSSSSRAPDIMPLQVNFPSTATFLGGAPTFEPGKTYEMSIKNGCVVCAEVVSA